MVESELRMHKALVLSPTYKKTHIHIQQLGDPLLKIVWV